MDRLDLRGEENPEGRGGRRGLSTPYLIETLEVRGRRIVVRPGPEFRRTYTDVPFYSEYDDEVDLASLPEEILLLPFLFNVLPVIWRSGAQYRIRSLDPEVAASLAEVRESLRRLHPRFSWRGELIPDRLSEPRAVAEARQDRLALLFSGGADSVYSSLVHRETSQVLVTILSALGVYDWENPNAHKAARDHFERNAKAFGHRSAFVSSNLCGYVPYPKLAGLWPRPRRWLVEVQHGLGFVGLMAPLLTHLGVRRLLMAGCELDHYGLPSGSHPAILGAIRWSGGRVEPDGNKATRQEKIRTIHAITGSGGGPTPVLKPCLRPVEGFVNCGICSKCQQTILGLLAEGADPAAYGFAESPERSLAALRSALRSFRLLLPDVGEIRQWLDIQTALNGQRKAGTRIDGLSSVGEADLDWFLSYDLERHYARHHGPARQAIRRVRGRVGIWLKEHPGWDRPIRAVQRSVRRAFDR